MQKRALSAIRLSVKKDETTSPERQDAANRARITQLGAELVGTASDLNVSASKVEPFSRPQLGEWLTNRADEFDIVVWWRWDRAIRSMKDLTKLVEWAQEKEKKLVFCEGPGSDLDFDFTDGKARRKGSMAILIANIVAWAAEVESQNISDRVTGSQQYLRERGEWGGGTVPYGFEPMRIKGQDRGWTLVHSPETMPVLKGIIDGVMDDQSLLSICNELNEAGVPSPRDAWLKIKERRKAVQDTDKVESDGDEEEEPRAPRLWNTNGLKIILTSRALLGETVYEGRPVLDKDRNPIQRSVPVLELHAWKALQAKIAERAMEPKTRYEDPNHLLGLAYCARCGERYYMKQETQKGRVYTSLSCRSRHGGGRKSCGQPTLSMTYAIEIVNMLALSIFGEEEQKIRRYVAGSDMSAELVMWQERIEYLKEEWDEGLLNDRAEYKARLAKYQEKINAIGPETVIPAGYRFEGTGKTYNEVWSGLDMAKRRRMLLNLGVKIFLGRGSSPAAEEAEEKAKSFQKEQQYSRIAVWDELDVRRALANVKDGRISKDFKTWLLQANQQEIPDLLGT